MVDEVKVEHVLMFVITAFLLYHLIGNCGCTNRGDGFSVGGKTNTKCMSAMRKNCPTNCSSTLQKCQVCTGQHSQIKQAGCTPSDLKNYCDNHINFFPETISITINASQLVNKVWKNYNKTFKFTYTFGICKDKSAANLNIPPNDFDGGISICTYYGVDDGNIFRIYWDRNKYTVDNTIFLTIELDIGGEIFYFTGSQMCTSEVPGSIPGCQQNVLTYINAVNNSKTFTDYVTKLMLFYTNEEPNPNYRNMTYEIQSVN
jgi:hypothetical protein